MQRLFIGEYVTMERLSISLKRAIRLTAHRAQIPPVWKSKLLWKYKDKTNALSFCETLHTIEEGTS